MHCGAFKPNGAGVVKRRCSVKRFHIGSSAEHVYFCELLRIQRQGRVTEIALTGQIQV